MKLVLDVVANDGVLSIYDPDTGNCVLEWADTFDPLMCLNELLRFHQHAKNKIAAERQRIRNADEEAT